MKFLFENLIGITSITILVLNTVILSCLLIPLGIIKFFLPITSLKVLFTKFIIKVGEFWIFTNKIWVKALHNPKWQIVGKENIKSDGWTIATSNHQSFADIFLLQDITNRKMPMLKFFMKYVLIYVPIIGLSWWALDMPFLKRYTKEEIQKNPELRGKDIKAMEKSFERYSRYPVSIFSFAEGTRFTKEKKDNQLSQFEYLLNPKIGGIGLTLTTMPYIKLLLDFTIHYEDERRSFWDFLCGRMSKADVRVRQINIPDDLLGKNYEDDPIFRENLKEWVYDIWSDKEKYLEEVRK